MCVCARETEKLVKLHCRDTAVTATASERSEYTVVLSIILLIVSPYSIHYRDLVGFIVFQKVRFPSSCGHDSRPHGVDDGLRREALGVGPLVQRGLPRAQRRVHGARLVHEALRARVVEGERAGGLGRQREVEGLVLGGLPPE